MGCKGFFCIYFYLSKEGGKIMYFQDMMLKLMEYWSKENCIILEPYDVEKGAGTMNPPIHF